MKLSIKMLCLLLAVLGVEQATAQPTVEALGGYPTDLKFELFGEKVKIIQQGIFKRAYGDSYSTAYYSKKSSGENAHDLPLVYDFEMIIKKPSTRHYADSMKADAGNHLAHFFISYLGKGDEVLFKDKVTFGNLGYNRSSDDKYVTISFWLHNVPMVVLTETAKIVFEEPRE